MSEMQPEGGGGGGMGSALTGSKIMGIPTIVWVGGIALIVYFLFFRNSGAGSSPTSGNTGDTATGASATLNQGAVSVTVTQTNPPDSTGDSETGEQPQPPVPGTVTTESVPKVIGKRANAGIKEVEKAGFKYKSTTGPRNPKRTYTISSESPAGGTKAPSGSTIDLGFKQR